MKSVLISIQPRWCELIAAGKKTVEVRKTQPKLETPFKVYIYCTKDKHGWFHFGKKQRLDGMVIGEFVCDRIDRKTPDCLIVKEDRERATAGSCLTAKEIRDYVRGNRTTYNLADLPDFYCWHISNLQIYEKPKPLYDFYKCGALPFEDMEETVCGYCSATDCGDKKCYHTPSGVLMCEGRWCDEAYQAYLDEEFSLTRAPQSWCYVEELK